MLLDLYINFNGFNMHLLCFIWNSYIMFYGFLLIYFWVDGYTWFMFYFVTILLIYECIFKAKSLKEIEMPIIKVSIVIKIINNLESAIN